MSDASRPRILEGRRWRDQWERVPGEQRARIHEAVKAGQSLADPEDAALAVGLAMRRRTVATWGVVAGAIVAVVVIGAGTRESANFAIAGLALLPLAAAGWAHKNRAAALRAELRNRDVVYEAMARSAPAPPDAPVADPWAGLPPPKPAPDAFPAASPGSGTDAHAAQETPADETEPPG